MKIYFEDGVLQFSQTLPFEYEHRIDGQYGYSSNKNDLDYLLNFKPSAIVYTNSLVALNSKYAWNTELGVPELYIRVGEHDLFMRIDKLTNRELKQAHNLEKLYISGEFL